MVVIEVGLDEEQGHVKRDLEKLADWVSAPGRPTGFLLHFIRDPTVPIEEIEKTMLQSAESLEQVETRVAIREPNLLVAEVTRAVQ